MKEFKPGNLFHYGKKQLIVFMISDEYRIIINAATQNQMRLYKSKVRIDVLYDRLL